MRHVVPHTMPRPKQNAVPQTRGSRRCVREWHGPIKLTSLHGRGELQVPSSDWRRTRNRVESGNFLQGRRNHLQTQCLARTNGLTGPKGGGPKISRVCSLSHSMFALCSLGRTSRGIVVAVGRGHGPPRCASGFPVVIVEKRRLSWLTACTSIPGRHHSKDRWPPLQLRFV